MSTAPIRVLVTGANGQVGRELQHTCPPGHEVIACDRNTLDITDEAATRRRVEQSRASVVINCAAYTAVDKAESEPDLAYRINRDGAANLAAAAHATGAQLVHISTDFVFDGSKSSPYLPVDIPNPLGVYGRSKLEGEQAVLAASDGRATIIRTAWLYSAHGSNFVKTMLRLLHERTELRIVADQVGTPTAAHSLAQTIWSMLDKRAPAGVYHFSDAGVASWYDFTCAIRELAGVGSNVPLPPVRPIRTEDYPTPANRPAYSVLDKSDIAPWCPTLRHWREPLTEVLRKLLA